MNKLKITTLALLTLLAACGTKTPEPEEPAYYFRFEADGEAFDYKYECEDGFSGGRCSMWGAPSGNSATESFYHFYGFNMKLKSYEGRMTFYVDKDDVMNMDTIILQEGGNSVSINKLKLSKYDASNYGLRNPLGGKLIITERTDNSIKGTFEFDVYKYFINPDTSHGEISDTVMQVRNGSFYVPARFP